MNMMNNNMQEMLRRIQTNPKEFIQRAGKNVPDEILNDPKAIVMHLINTNQVSGPLAQTIIPMIRSMGGR